MFKERWTLGRADRLGKKVSFTLSVHMKKRNKTNPIHAFCFSHTLSHYLNIGFSYDFAQYVNENSILQKGVDNDQGLLY